MRRELGGLTAIEDGLGDVRREIRRLQHTPDLAAVDVPPTDDTPLDTVQAALNPGRAGLVRAQVQKMSAESTSLTWVPRTYPANNTL